MDKVIPADLAATREYFVRELHSAMVKQKVNAHPGSLPYLVELLVRYMNSETFFVKSADGRLEENTLVDLYAAYLQGGAEVKRQTLQRLGDICLLITGFFSDSIHRKVVDLDYYFGMGGSAYLQLSHFHAQEVKHLFVDLAQKIRPFSNVLSEVSEKGGVHNNTDLLRVYERWLTTGNERLRALLSQHGISALSNDPKTKH